MATITKPASESQGKFFYKDMATSVICNEGDELVVEVTDLEASSTFQVVVLAERVAEVPANNADMVLSA